MRSPQFGRFPSCERLRHVSSNERICSVIFANDTALQVDKAVDKSSRSALFSQLEKSWSVSYVVSCLTMH
jgi:hypothetical protein